MFSHLGGQSSCVDSSAHHLEAVVVAVSVGHAGMMLIQVCSPMHGGKNDHRSSF